MSADDFRALLKRHRERWRWSQERCAAESALDHSLVSRLEGGQRAPTRESCLKLAAGLRLTDGERDALLISAGYAPIRRGSMVADEPGVAEVYALLRDPTIAAPVKLLVREQLAALVRVAAQTTRVRPPVSVETE